MMTIKLLGALSLVLLAAATEENPRSLEYNNAEGIYIGAQLVTLEGTTIVNKEKLVGGETYAFDSSKGYTIEVDTDGSMIVSFFYETDESTSYTPPFWLAGEMEGGVAPSKYLDTCGPKSVTIMGKSGKTVLFEENLSFALVCTRGECNNDGYSCPEYATSTTACPMSFDDCTCGASLIKAAGRCVPTGFLRAQVRSGQVPAAPVHPVEHVPAACDNPFVCPGKSTPISPCPATIQDCQCSEPITCPANMIPGTYCIASVKECACATKFQCPEGLVRDKECPATLDDCECDGTPFVCPVGYTPAVACPSSIAQCYMDVEDEEDDEDECDNNGFVCPVDSYSDLSSCAYTFADCTCAEGFIREGDECTPIADYVPPNEPFVCENGGFECPKNTESISLCPTSNEDCLCDTFDICAPGTLPKMYCPTSQADCAADVDACASTFVCPDGQVPFEDCPVDLGDCVCADPAFEKVGDGCRLKQPTVASSSVGVCNNAFSCSPGMVALNDCPQNELDCVCAGALVECPIGFKSSAACPSSLDECVKDESCPSPFSCPFESVPTTDCPRSIDDCKCGLDLFMQFGRCVSCFVPGCKWTETYDHDAQRCVPNTYPAVFPGSFECPSRSYNVHFRNTGTMLDCECNCFKQKNVCTNQCTESCNGSPL